MYNYYSIKYPKRKEFFSVKKRFLVGLMALMMLCALFPTAIFAEAADFGVGDTGTAKIAMQTQFLR